MSHLRNRQIQIDTGFGCSKMHWERESGRMETGNGQVVDTGLEAKGPPDGLADERRHWSKGTAPAGIETCCLVSRN